MKKAYIKDITFHVPEKILTNDDLSKVMDTSDEWISTRTGIKQRHVVGETGEGPVDLAVKASEKLLSKIIGVGDIIPALAASGQFKPFIMIELILGFGMYFLAKNRKHNFVDTRIP